MPIADDRGRPPAGRFRLDADGQLVGRYDHVEVDEHVYADVFDRAPGVTVECTAEALLADLGGTRVVADEDLGRWPAARASPRSASSSPRATRRAASTRRSGSSSPGPR
jgi:hypothetical protein